MKLEPEELDDLSGSSYWSMKPLSEDRPGAERPLPSGGENTLSPPASDFPFSLLPLLTKL